QWKIWLNEFGLQLNLVKDEYLECDVQTNNRIIVDGALLVKAPDFHYFTFHIKTDGDRFLDARAQVNAAWLKWRQVTGVLCNWKILLCLKSKIYYMVVCPVALHGTKCWATMKRHNRHSSQWKYE
ncbi:hypothetical protein NXF25_003351, partial [Crotalus adamanteus]